MANVQTECLNEKCSNRLDEINLKWCGMRCKEQFLIDNYSKGQSLKWFQEHNEDFKTRQRNVMEQINKSGLSFSEFIISLRKFKDGTK